MRLHLVYLRWCLRGDGCGYAAWSVCPPQVPDPSKLLRRPISISEIDYNKKEATIVYRVEREGTAILSKMVAGQTIDTMGPQGNGFDISVIEAGQKALLVGGGIGVPPWLRRPSS
mgnify:CR=1 FL=1